MGNGACATSSCGCGEDYDRKEDVDDDSSEESRLFTLGVQQTPPKKRSRAPRMIEVPEAKYSRSISPQSVTVATTASKTL